MLCCAHQVVTSIPSGRFWQSLICAAHWLSLICCATRLVSSAMITPPSLASSLKSWVTELLRLFQLCWVWLWHKLTLTKRYSGSTVYLSSNVRCAFFAMVVSPLVGCHPEICWKYDYNRRGSAPWTPRFIALCFHRSKEKEQHTQCCSCVTLDAAQVAPQRCPILHFRESNYILIDYWPVFNRLGKGLEELLLPPFLQW